MNLDQIEMRILVLVLVNIPILIGLGRMFFSNWGEFFSAFIPEFDFGFWSWILDIHTRATWENMKLVVFAMLSLLLLYGEYTFFWQS